MAALVNVTSGTCSWLYLCLFCCGYDVMWVSSKCRECFGGAVAACPACHSCQGPLFPAVASADQDFARLALDNSRLSGRLTGRALGTSHAYDTRDHIFDQGLM